jgi:ATP-dependent DNA ligase
MVKLQSLRAAGIQLAYVPPGRVSSRRASGNDLTYRFPLIVETFARLRSRSCIIDGEAVSCDGNGVTSFNRIRYRYH